MQRKILSIGEADAPHVLSVYNWEVGTFQVVDAGHEPAEKSDWCETPDERTGPQPETWRSRVKEVAAWIVADILTGFVSCAVAMNPHLFRMMDEFDAHMERSKKHIAPEEND
jgi:hypothetical protein